MGLACGRGCRSARRSRLFPGERALRDLGHGAIRRCVGWAPVRHGQSLPPPLRGEGFSRAVPMRGRTPRAVPMTPPLSRPSPARGEGTERVRLSHFCYSEILSSPKIKNISVFQYHKSVYKSPRPDPTEGRIMIVTNVRRDAVDAGVAKTNAALWRTAKTCGPDARNAGVKFSGSLPPGATVATEFRLTGESTL